MRLCWDHHCMRLSVTLIAWWTLLPNAIAQQDTCIAKRERELEKIELGIQSGTLTPDVFRCYSYIAPRVSHVACKPGIGELETSMQHAECESGVSQCVLLRRPYGPSRFVFAAGCDGLGDQSYCSA